jgi:hypothetical protein
LRLRLRKLPALNLRDQCIKQAAATLLKLTQHVADDICLAGIPAARRVKASRALSAGTAAAHRTETTSASRIKATDRNPTAPGYAAP